MTNPNQPLDYSQYNPEAESGVPTSIKVLSIIGIVWAAFGFCCAPMGMLQFMIKMPPPQDAITADMRADSLLFGSMAGGNLLVFCLSIVLLIGSIGSLARKKFAWTAMVVYAMLSIVTGLIWMYVSFAIVMPKIEAIMQKHGLPSSKLMLYSGVVIGLLALVYQVLILVFYSRPKVKAAFGK